MTAPAAPAPDAPHDTGALALRARAEALWQARTEQAAAEAAAQAAAQATAQAGTPAAAQPAAPAQPPSADATQRLLHDLQVHQIELEMQNDELRRTQLQLEGSRAHFFALYDLAPVGYLTLTEGGTVAQANLAAATLLALPRAALVGQPVSSLIFAADQDAYYLNRKQLLKTGQVAPWALRLRRADGQPVWVQMAASLAPGADGGHGGHGGDRAAGAATGLLLVLTDISARLQAEDALRRSEARFRRIMESDLLGLIFWAGDGRIAQANDAFLRMVGHSRAELQAGQLDWAAMTPPEYRALDEAALAEVALHGSCRPYEKEYLRRDGTRLPILIGSASFAEQPGEGVAFVLDISERRCADAAVQRLLLDKDALLKEVHHRVKNNLQIIHSLLRLEHQRQALPAVRQVLQAMQGRIQAMATLHDTLHHSGHVAALDLGAYLERLATQAWRALASGRGHVQLQLDLASVAVSLEQAVPCGLLVNELVSNSLQHGFADGRSGELRVWLQRLDGGTLQLGVSDSGAGLPADFAARRSAGLGLQLVADLAGQIGGQLEIGPGPAAAFSLCFATTATALAATAP